MATNPASGDPGPAWAYAFATGLGDPGPLPASLANVDRLVEMIENIDKPLFGIEQEPQAVMRNFGTSIAEIARTAETYMPDLLDSLARVNIALRLWAGCIGAAKTIALDTRSGPNTPSGRAVKFTGIDACAASDEIFAAGVEAAPAFKLGRGEEYSLDGVPLGSRVRRNLP